MLRNFIYFSVSIKKKKKKSSKHKDEDKTSATVDASKKVVKKKVCIFPTISFR